MDVDLIQKVIFTLNGVEVKGEENLDRLLGCINVLKEIVAQESKEGEVNG